MERKTTIEEAEKIMGINFIGINQLKSIEAKMGIYIPQEVVKNPPTIQYSVDTLKKLQKEYLLILGVPYYKDKSPLTIVKMREHFGIDPDNSEPCFYNQDWYINEEFAKKKSFDLKWYLVKINAFDEFRGLSFNDSRLKDIVILPQTVVLVYVFFAVFFLQGGVLWINDYIWTQDTDDFYNQIYIGNYQDYKSTNKNGIEIHRFLTLNQHFGVVNCF